MDFAKDLIVKLVMENGQLIALIIGGLMAAGMALGSAKKVTAKLLTASLGAGEAITSKLMEKPKAMLLGGAFVGLTLPAWWLGYSRAPEKIVERRVPYAVTDNQMIDSLRQQLAASEGEKSQAVAHASGIENQLASARRSVDAITRQRHEAEQQVALLTQKIADLSPASEKAKLNQLQASVDQMHQSGIVDEVAQLKRSKRFDYTKYRSVRHKGFHNLLSFDGTLYHLRCAACDKNLRTNQAIDEIYTRHPDWGSGLLTEPEPRPKLVTEADIKFAEWKSRNDAIQRSSITAFGETKTIIEWAKDDLKGANLDASTIAMRVEEGWEPRKAIEVARLSPEETKTWKELYERKRLAKEAEKARRRAIPDTKVGQR